MSPACPHGPGVGQTEHLLLQPPHQQIALAVLSTIQASESRSEAEDVGLGEPSVIYPALRADPHLLGYSCSLTGVGEAHSGGRADTASRIQLPLINRGSPDYVSLEDLL